MYLSKRICFRVFCHINIPLSNDMRYLYKNALSSNVFVTYKVSKVLQDETFIMDLSIHFVFVILRHYEQHIHNTYHYCGLLLEFLVLVQRHLRILHSCINWLYILFRDIFLDMRNVKTVWVLSMSHLIWITQTVHLTLSTLIIVPYIMRVSWKFSVGERILFMTLLN